jgi:hypothetical protein
LIGIDIGKNSFHVAGHDARGAIVLRQKVVAWPSGSAARRSPTLPDRHEACVDAHHLSRKSRIA